MTEPQGKFRISFLYTSLALLQLPSPLIHPSWREMLIPCEFCRMKHRLREVCERPCHTAGCNVSEAANLPWGDLANSQLSVKTVRMNLKWKMEAETAIWSTAITSSDPALYRVPGAALNQSPNFLLRPSGKKPFKCHRPLCADVESSGGSEMPSVFPREAQQGNDGSATSVGLPDLPPSQSWTLCATQIWIIHSFNPHNPRKVIYKCKGALRG